jgi:hypothetical protein
MRKLSDLEFNSIKTRLDSLQIVYKEIYDELLDHYISQLEKKDQPEFEQELEKLNETFAWSVVKGMEKNLEKQTNKLIAKIQWESLKIWKFSPNEFFTGLLIAGLMFISFLTFKLEGLFMASSILALAGIILAWNKQGKGISFSLNPKKQKPVACVSRVILSRLGLLYGCLSWFWIGVSNWGESNPGPIGTTLGIIICTIIFLYTISLLKVSITYKRPELNVLQT